MADDNDFSEVNPKTRRELRSDGLKTRVVSSESVSTKSFRNVFLGLLSIGFFFSFLGGLYYFDKNFSWGTKNSALAAVDVAVASSEQSIVCLGGLNFFEDNLSKLDQTYSSRSNEKVTSFGGVAFSGLLGTPGKTVLQNIGLPDVSNDFVTKGRAAFLSGNNYSGVSRIFTQPVEGEKSYLAGLQTNFFGDGDLRGLAASSCKPNASDVWLLGGATTVGRQATLVLVNSSSEVGVVDISLYGELGYINAAGTKNIVVAPNSTKYFPLAGFAVNESLLALHVESVGSPVVAAVQSNVVRGVTPGGVDFVTASAAASGRQIIPGVRIFGDQSFVDVDRDAKPVVRVFVPGSVAANVVVNAYSTDDSGVVLLKDLVLPAGKVSEIDLTDLSVGDYVLELVSEVSLVASARISYVDGVDKVAEFTWVPSGSVLREERFVAFPAEQASLRSSLGFFAADADAKVFVQALTVEGVFLEGVELQLLANKMFVFDSQHFAADKQIVGLVLQKVVGDVYVSQLVINDSNMFSSVDSFDVFDTVRSVKVRRF